MSNTTILDKSLSRFNELDVDALNDLYDNVDPIFLSEYKPDSIQQLMETLPVRGVSFPDESQLDDHQKMQLRELAWSSRTYDGWNMSAEMSHDKKRKVAIRTEEEEEEEKNYMPDHNPIFKRSNNES